MPRQEPIDYDERSQPAMQAWNEYRRTNEVHTLSFSSFLAGWNACNNQPEQQELSEMERFYFANYEPEKAKEIIRFYDMCNSSPVESLN